MSHRHILLASAAMASAFSGAALAADKSSTNTIEELIVTAEKREQNLQVVPVAISAYTAKDRETKGIISIQDITNFTPGLSYSSNLDRAAIRGVGRLTNRLSSDAAVATYSDGFYTTSVAEVGKSTLAVDRVEVLRGPQGTLYGRNAIAGAINVISKRPTQEPYAEARITAGNYKLQNYEIAASGPLSDQLRVRGYAQYVHQDDGYFRNVATGKRADDALNRYYVEFQADADLGPNTQFWFKYATAKWTDESGNSGGGVGDRNYDFSLGGVDSLSFNAAYGLQTRDPLTGGLINGRQVGSVTNNPQLTDVRTFNSNFPNGTNINNDNIHILAVHFNHQFDSFEFKYVGGYDSYYYDQISDGDGVPVLSFQIPLNASPLPAQNTCQYVAGCQPLTIDASGNQFRYTEDNEWFSSEVNFASTTDKPLQWIVGAYYFKEWYKNPQVASGSQPGYRNPTGAAVGNPFGSAPNPKGETYHFDYDMSTRSIAGFGQLDWKPRPEWQFTAGIRYTRDDKEGFEQFRSLCYTVACIGNPRVFGTLVGNTILDITTLLAASYTSSTAEAAIDGVATPARQVGASFVNYNIDPATGLARRDLKNNWSGVTGNLSAQWTPSDDTNLYFRYGRGYKSGGYNAGEIVSSPSTDAEFVDAFEIGLKQDIGNRLRLNMAAFYYDYADLQIPIRVANSTTLGTVLQTRFLNVPKSVSQGFELEGQWNPVNNLQLTFSYSLNDTKVQTACTPTDLRACVLDTADPLAQDVDAKSVLTINTSDGLRSLQSLKGNRLPYAPKSKVALNANYNFVFSKSVLNISGSIVWRDESYANLFTREYNRAPAWDSTDFRASWRTNDGRYTVIAYLRNAFDQLTYPAAGNGFRLAPDSATPTKLNNVSKTLGLNPPRTFGMAVYYKFR